MADGALRTDVLMVLGQGGVEVTPLPESRFRLAKADVVLTVRLAEVISRTVVANMERRFGIPKSKFFPAASTFKVVPIDRPKAAGEPE